MSQRILHFVTTVLMIATSIGVQAQEYRIEPKSCIGGPAAPSNALVTPIGVLCFDGQNDTYARAAPSLVNRGTAPHVFLQEVILHLGNALVEQRKQLEAARKEIEVLKTSLATAESNAIKAEAANLHRSKEILMTIEALPTALAIDERFLRLLSIALASRANSAAKPNESE